MCFFVKYVNQDPLNVNHELMVNFKLKCNEHFYIWSLVLNKKKYEKNIRQFVFIINGS